MNNCRVVVGLIFIRFNTYDFKIIIFSKSRLYEFVTKLLRKEYNGMPVEFAEVPVAPEPIKETFQVGDHVEVISEGKHKGRTGVITKICKRTFSDYNQYQINGCWVFEMKALKKRYIPASESKKTVQEENEMVTIETKKPVTQKIVNMWYDKKKAKIEEKIRKQKDEIIAADLVKQTFDAKIEELKKWYEEELVPDKVKRTRYEFWMGGNNMADTFSTAWGDILLTDETKEKLDIINQKKEENISLANLKKEIETILSGCANVEDEWEILMAYNVINTDKRLMV